MLLDERTGRHFSDGGCGNLRARANADSGDGVDNRFTQFGIERRIGGGQFSDGNAQRLGVSPVEPHAMFLQSFDAATTNVIDQLGRDSVRIGVSQRRARDKSPRLSGTERPVRRGNRCQHHLNATVGLEASTDYEEPVNDMTPQSAFLAAFSLHPAGVAVITANDSHGEPVGFTATSLASFSAVPPRASFNIAQHASSYRSVGIGARVLLHFLAGHQVEIARIMAGPAAQRFEGDHWSADDRGLPRLTGVRAVLEAHVVAVTEVGDNASVIVEIDGGDTNIDCSPLVYVERRYHAVGDVVD